MKRPTWATDEMIERACELADEGAGRATFMTEFGLTENTARALASYVKADPADRVEGGYTAQVEQQKIDVEEMADGSIKVSATPINRGSISASWTDLDGLRHFGLTTEQELRAVANIPEDYELLFMRPNSWAAQDGEGPFIAHQIRGTFRPASSTPARIESLLERLRKESPSVPMFARPYMLPDAQRRMLEISIVDPHIGMICKPPTASQEWGPEIAYTFFMWAIDSMLMQAQMYAPFDTILFPFGNDFLHAEIGATNRSVGHMTAAGTDQPEMMAWHDAYILGEEIAIRAIEKLSEIAPVVVPVIPGNHDRWSAYTLGRVLFNRFYNDENVTVLADANPYKFIEYGQNLIGFEHGHSIARVRMAAVMANEAKEAWARTSFREWHCGDQHRKGSSVPTVFEEQGVSIEFLPGLTPVNDWHKLKSFSWQKRAATAYVWNRDTGPEARLQAHINAFTGQPFTSDISDPTPPNALLTID